jgi:hypothetical protein
MGHCMESGYAVIDDDGMPHLLDSHATPHVVAALTHSDRQQCAYIAAHRTSREGEMVTDNVAEGGL